jgi:hypothetical protein
MQQICADPKMEGEEEAAAAISVVEGQRQKEGEVAATSSDVSPAPEVVTDPATGLKVQILKFDLI